MATTQPTPPSNPTTNSEETTTTTTQQTQEPEDTSEGIETELSVSEIATDLPILGPSEPTDIGLIIGIVMVVIVVIALVTAVMVIIIAVLVKKRSEKMTTVAVPTTTNQAYGLTHHSEIRVEESIYDHPEVDLDNTIEAKQNEAYVTNTDIITAEAYATNIITEKNTAYRPVTTVETIDEYDYI